MQVVAVNVCSQIEPSAQLNVTQLMDKLSHAVDSRKTEMDSPSASVFVLSDLQRVSSWSHRVLVLG